VFLVSGAVLFQNFYGTVSTNPSLNTNCDEISSFSFLALSDVPYTPKDFDIFSSTLNHIGKVEPVLFAIHAGDIVPDPKPKTDPKVFTKRYNLFNSFSKPFVMVPGDNETNDQPDPENALQFFRHKFVPLAHKNNLLKIARQKGQMENLFFHCKGVLFIGINLQHIGNRNKDDWARTNKASREWLIYNLLNNANNAKGIIIFMQTQFRTFESIFFEVKNILEYLGKPTLILGGDVHDENFSRYYPIRGEVYKLVGFHNPNNAFKVNVTHSRTTQSVKFSVEIVGKNSAKPLHLLPIVSPIIKKDLAEIR